ncbi:LysR substrate-binding domain-containing protein [Streptomyces sp. NPDC050504]|uniref:LysR substrate-binding domain-containing protein n=1 Tax=Streptomyces sp. NPDC050504 TaxID=3365618 RepID=UPI00378990FB
MELRQLEYLLAVAEEASFTRAAARLHVTQPGVSSQIRQLERELGHPLLDRSGRTVRLTEVGATVARYARTALAAVAGARAAVDEHAGLLRGRVAVGTVTSSSSAVDLPGLFAAFHRAHPAVEISLSESSSDEITAALAAGRLDVAVIAPAAAPPPGLGLQVIADEQLVAAVAVRDPLAAAGRESVPLTELADRPLITFTRSTGTREAVDTACAAAGFRPRVAFEAGDPHTLARLAALGLGVAILPEPYAHDHPADLHVLFTHPAVRGRLALAWRSAGTQSPAARAFTALARTTLGTIA